MGVHRGSGRKFLAVVSLVLLLAILLPVPD
jgi:hypothetical protein